MGKKKNADLWTPEQKAELARRKEQVKVLKETVRIAKQAGIPVSKAEKSLNDIDKVLKQISGT